MSHPEEAIYQAQGMGNASGMGAAPALVLVDFVVGFADPARKLAFGLTKNHMRTTVEASMGAAALIADLIRGHIDRA